MAKPAFEKQRLAPARYARDPVGFIDQCLPRNEKGAAWRLSAYQRRVLALAFVWDRTGALAIRLLVWSEVKKSGKTAVAAMLAIWWAATRANSEVIVVAADKEQAVGRVFKTVVQLLRTNGFEHAKLARIRANVIDFASGTTVTAIASEYRGAAGSRHSLVIYDEIWGYDREALERLYEELTPPPTEPDAWVLVVTYAGFVGESRLLEAMYQRGLAGERIDPELEVYRDADMVMFWSHTPRQPWQTPEYYEQQRRSLRPATFARIHENRWVSSESKFITPELWDRCVDPALTPVLADADLAVSVAVDAALKSDNAAVVAVAWQGSRLRLVAHRIWRPTKAAPLDLEATVEAFVRDLDRRFDVREVVVDPWQMARSVATLKADGIPVREMPQTAATLQSMASTLWDVIDGQNIRLYPADDLREHALNAVAVETPRGLKLAKEKASKKVDGAVALAMACVAAVGRGPEDDAPLMLVSADPNSLYQEWLRSRGGWRDDEPEPGREDEEPEVIEATEDEIAARPDAADWVRLDDPRFMPRAERRKQHHDRAADIAAARGAWFPEDQ